MATPAHVVHRFGGIEFEPAELRLRRDGAWVDLQPKISRTLGEVELRRGGEPGWEPVGETDESEKRDRAGWQGSRAWSPEA